MISVIRRLSLIAPLSIFCISSQAQPADKKETLPYRVLTSGKQITIKSSKTILSVMLWTTSGHRVIEQREINAGSFSFTIPINEKIFFLMVGLVGGKIYTEKIGVQ